MRFFRRFLWPKFPAVNILQLLSSNYIATVLGKVIVASASLQALHCKIILLLAPDKGLASKQRQEERIKQQTLQEIEL